MTAYAVQCQAIQWDGDNITDVEAWFADNSIFPGVDFSGWTLADNGDGTLHLTGPSPRKPITVHTTDWLLAGYGLSPIAINDATFQRYFIPGV